MHHKCVFIHTLVAENWEIQPAGYVHTLKTQLQDRLESFSKQTVLEQNLTSSTTLCSCRFTVHERLFPTPTWFFCHLCVMLVQKCKFTLNVWFFFSFFCTPESTRNSCAVDEKKEQKSEVGVTVLVLEELIENDADWGNRWMGGWVGGRVLFRKIGAVRMRKHVELKRQFLLALHICLNHYLWYSLMCCVNVHWRWQSRKSESSGPWYISKTPFAQGQLPTWHLCQSQVLLKDLRGHICWGCRAGRMEEEVREEAQRSGRKGGRRLSQGGSGGGICLPPHLSLPSSHSHIQILPNPPPSFIILPFLS